MPGVVLGVVAVALAGLGLRLALVARPIAVLDRLFVPDDTYYTLTIARSLADGHGPTVDGATLTSGFQPLLGFLMVPVFWLTDSPDLALRVDLVLLALADAVTIALVAWLAHRLAGPVAAIVAAVLWAISPVAVSMVAGGLETSLAIALGAGLVACWIHAADRARRRWWVATGVLAGLAVLARIDLLALVALLAAVQALRGPRRPLLVVGGVAAVVVAPWWAWCTVELGTPVPTSGAAVHELAPFGPFARENLGLAVGAVAGGPFGVWDDLRAAIVDGWTLGAIAFAVVVAALVALALVLSRAGRLDRAWSYAAALPAFAAVLLVFYAWFGVVWFYTRYLAPVALVGTVLVAVGGARLRPPRRTVASGALVVVAVLGAILLVQTVRTQVRWLRIDRRPAAEVGAPSSYDAVTGYREPVRRALRAIPDGAVVSGWQSGALGYYGTGRTVVNLDGAVNPEAAGATGTELARYLRERRIEWLADFALVVVRLRFDLAALRPPPTSRIVATVPAAGATPEYSVARLSWP